MARGGWEDGEEVPIRHHHHGQSAPARLYLGIDREAALQASPLKPSLGFRPWELLRDAQRLHQARAVLRGCCYSDPTRSGYRSIAPVHYVNSRSA
jgi:hypothetical protein